MPHTEEFTRIAADTLNDYFEELSKKETRINEIINGADPVETRIASLKKSLMENIKNELTFGDYLKRTVVEGYMNEGGTEEVTFQTITDQQCIKNIQKIFEENGMKGIGSLHGGTRLTPANLRRWMQKPLGEVSRDMVFLFGFGLNMFAEEVEQYLKQLSGGKGFYWKNPEEVIIYFALKHNRGYSGYVALLDRYCILDDKRQILDLNIDVTEEVQRCRKDKNYAKIFRRIAEDTCILYNDLSYISCVQGTDISLRTEEGLAQYLKILKIMKEMQLLTFKNIRSITISHTYTSALKSFYNFWSIEPIAKMLIYKKTEQEVFAPHTSDEDVSMEAARAVYQKVAGKVGMEWEAFARFFCEEFPENFWKKAPEEREKILKRKELRVGSNPEMVEAGTNWTDCLAKLHMDVEAACKDPAIPYLEAPYLALLKKSKITYQIIIHRTEGMVDASREDIILLCFLYWAKLTEENNHLDPREISVRERKEEFYLLANSYLEKAGFGPVYLANSYEMLLLYFLLQEKPYSSFLKNWDKAVGIR